MNHYIKIFLSFFFANYLLLYCYDNYYLAGLESDYLIDSRNQLRQYALDLRSELTKGSVKEEVIINQWANSENIPTQILEFVASAEEPNTVSELTSFDYQIDLYSAMGPTVQLSLGETKIVEIGPLDPLNIESTSLQPKFIVLSLLVNILVTYLLFYFFKKQTGRIEKALASIMLREQISNQQLGGQDVLSTMCHKLLELNDYISEIEEHNFQVSNDQRDLMHAVAHELRSPIARFSFALELMEDSTKTEDEKRLVEEMQGSIDELEALIKEILSYSRLSYGKMVVEFEPINIVETISVSIARLKSVYPQQEFLVVDEASEIFVQADRRLIERAIVNLLRNAARFAKKVVRVECLQENDQVCIAIDDDGIGIPPGKRARIFEAFTRLDPSRSRDSGGVGLGLAIVKKVVDRHQGRISVSDSHLGGAQFILKLPLMETGTEMPRAENRK